MSPPGGWFSCGWQRGLSGGLERPPAVETIRDRGHVSEHRLEDLHVRGHHLGLLRTPVPGAVPAAVTVTAVPAVVVRRQERPTVLRVLVLDVPQGADAGVGEA